MMNREQLIRTLQKNRWVVQLHHIIPHCRGGKMFHRLMNRVKFELKKHNGIVTTIDYCGLFGERIGVKGWTLSGKGAKAIQSIEVYERDVFLGNAVYGDARGDVANLYPFINQSDRCGFHFYGELPENGHRPGTEISVVIKVIATDGRCCEKRQVARDDYAKWIKQSEPDQFELARQARTTFPYAPLISLITPFHKTPRQFLIEMLESVLRQSYPHWELCLAGAADQSEDVRSLLETYTQKDPRIKVAWLSENKGIVGNSNEAVRLAAGDFVGLLDHDDTLAPFALFEVVRMINQHHNVDYLYSDEDRLSQDGTVRYDPHFKPDWSPDTLRSTNYPTHFSVFRRSLLDQIGGFCEDCEGSQDYDLILRATEQARKIVHIPKVLYHWRVHNLSLASNIASKEYACLSAQKALQKHLDRSGLAGNVEMTELAGYYKVTYPLKITPLVSILIPNRDHADDLNRCVRSILKKSTYIKESNGWQASTYPQIEIIIVENGSCEPKTFKVYETLQKKRHVRIIEWAENGFNYARINNAAARQAQGDVLVFLNNDTQVITPDWLERMLEHALRNEVGAVGAKLYYPNHTIQHAGLIIGLCGLAGHGHKCFPGHDHGYKGRLRIVQNVSAVTAACLMVRTELFRELGGFDEHYRLAYNDVDFCLRLREKGYVIVWTPYAELYHYESTTRGSEDHPEKQTRFEQEQSFFRKRWHAALTNGDPYYNPNLTLEREDFSIKD